MNLQKPNKTHIIAEEALLKPFLNGRQPYSFVQKLSAFINQQLSVWPELKQSQDLLNKSLTRRIFLTDLEVHLQHNHQRIKSTTSRVDKKSVEKRPCFLCPENLYPDQMALPYKKEWLILNNPFPIFKDHLVISHQKHLPQKIENDIDTMICFVKDTEFSFSLFYNGPACGASAPDHLHFQACPDGGLPITGQMLKLLEDSASMPSLLLLEESKKGKSFKGSVDGRTMFLCVSDNHIFLLERMIKTLRFIRRQTCSSDEPMINLIVSGMEKNYMGIIFPRKTHRPSCFYRKENAMIISPGAVDMGGLIVIPREQDYDKINKNIILEIFSEVSCGQDIFDGLAF